MVTVVPIDSEASLRHRDWIERTRRKVDQLSKGQVAYVYQPNTGDESLQEFDRYFFPQSDRAAVILDERFNRGGGDPDYQLDVLKREQVHWYRERNAPPFKSPFSIVAGPKVMLVNDEARSGGDVYPYQFKVRGLGTVVGTRTWGGVQGGGAGVPLIDGGFVRVPNLGTYAPNGGYILENTGFVPDVEVAGLPRRRRRRPGSPARESRRDPAGGAAAQPAHGRSAAREGGSLLAHAAALRRLA